MKTSSPTNCPSPLDNIFSVTEKNLLSETTASQAQLEFTCLNSAIITVEQSSKYVQS